MNNCIFTQHVLFGPHSCLGRCIIPHREPVAAISSHLSLAEPQELSFCCVARMLLAPLL